MKDGDALSKPVAPEAKEESQILLHDGVSCRHHLTARVEGERSTCARSGLPKLQAQGRIANSLSRHTVLHQRSVSAPLSYQSAQRREQVSHELPKLGLEWN